MKFFIFSLLVLPCVLAIIGGWSNYKTNINSSEVEFAVKKINEYYKNKDDDAERTAVSIVKAQKQLVNGWNYNLEIEVSDGVSNAVCSLTVWNDFLDKAEPYKLNDDKGVTCEKTNKKPMGPMTGASVDISIKSELVQKALIQVLDEMNKQMNSIYYYTYDGCDKITSQVVNGIIIRFQNLNLRQSTCTKEQALAAKDNLIQECPVDEKSDMVIKKTISVFVSSGTDPTYRVLLSSN